MAIWSRPGGAIFWRACVAFMHTICDPRVNVARHVIKPERVRGERANGHCPFKPAVAISAIGVCASLAAPRVFRVGSRTRGIFKLCLREQSILPARHPREPAGIA